MLSPEKHQKLVEHINAKWKSQACWLCGTNSWDVAAYVGLQLSDHGGLVIGGQFLPVVAVTCKNCGNTVLVNAIIAGISPELPQTPGDGMDEK